MAYYFIIPLIVGFIIMYWSSILDDNDELLKLVFRMFFLPMIFLSLHFAVLDVSLLYGADVNTITLLGDTVYYCGWLLFIIGAYYMFKVLGLVYNIVMQKRDEKEKNLYDD